MSRREYYLANKDKWLRDTEEKKEKHRQSSKKSAAKHREKRAVNNQQWAANNHQRVLYNQTKRGAASRGLEWDLTMEDFVIPEKCLYLDTPLTSIQGQGIVWTNASVDRIDNSKGYVKGNVQIVSRLANSMKQHATEEQLVTFATNILKRHKLPKLLKSD